MPLRWNGEKLVSVCINDGPPPEPEHTMGRCREWYLVQQIAPGPSPALLDAGVPVTAFVCNMCGYVELYSGRVIDPKAWEPSAE